MQSKQLSPRARHRSVIPTPTDLHRWGLLSTANVGEHFELRLYGWMRGIILEQPLLRGPVCGILVGLLKRVRRIFLHGSPNQPVLGAAPASLYYCLRTRSIDYKRPEASHLGRQSQTQINPGAFFPADYFMDGARNRHHANSTRSRTIAL